MQIELDGLASRLHEVPVAAGNYKNLTVNDKSQFWTSSAAGEPSVNLMALAIDNENPEAKSAVAGSSSYEMSGNGKKLLVHEGKNLALVVAALLNDERKLKLSPAATIAVPAPLMS